jgi:DNA-binding transcriptional LysR family regulator
VELRHLRTFVAVADHASFSKAAVALRLSQPALSRQIRDLEEELGRPLFRREPGQIVLTSSGALLLEKVRPLLATVATLPELVRAGAQGGRRLLRISHFGTFLALYLTPFLQRLRQHRPGLRVEMVELLPNEALKQVRAGEIDAVLTGHPGAARLRGLRHTLMYREQPTVLLRAGHSLLKKRRVQLAELAQEAWALWDERTFPSFGRSVEDACRRAGFTPRVKAVVDDMLEVYGGVAAGEYVGYMGSLTSPSRPPGVGTVRLVPGSIVIDTFLVWSPRGPVAEEIALLSVWLEAAAVQPSAGGEPR